MQHKHDDDGAPGEDIGGQAPPNFGGASSRICTSRAAQAAAAEGSAMMRCASSLQRPRLEVLEQAEQGRHFRVRCADPITIGMNNNAERTHG